MTLNTRTLQYHMNRLAGTLNGEVPTLDAQGAANEWAGTSGLALVGALNTKAGNTLPNYRELQGVLNQLVGNKLLLDGTAGTYASAPDTAALDVTGDIDIRIQVAMDDWSPSATQALVAKWVAAGDQRSYSLQVLTTGQIQFLYSTTGANTLTRNSTIAPGFTDGSEHWVRVTLDVDNGATQNETRFWTSEDGATWTQLGATVTSAGVASIHAGTAEVQVGARDGLVRLAGTVGRAEVRDGIDGTVVADPNFSAQPKGATSFSDDAGNIWTIGGGAAIVGRPHMAVDQAASEIVA